MVLRAALPVPASWAEDGHGINAPVAADVGGAAIHFDRLGRGMPIQPLRADASRLLSPWVLRVCIRDSTRQTGIEQTRLGMTLPADGASMKETHRPDNGEA